MKRPFFSPRVTVSLSVLLTALLTVGCDAGAGTSTTVGLSTHHAASRERSETINPRRRAAAAFQSVQGKNVEVPDPQATVTALVFVSSTCPIANGYAREINRLTQEYGSRGVTIALVHTESELTRDEAQQHLRDFGYDCPVLLDPQRTLVRQTGVTVTPEAAVLSAEGELLYRGRIDDRFPDIGVQRDAPTRTELRDALDAVLAGRPAPIARTTAVGCFIE